MKSFRHSRFFFYKKNKSFIPFIFLLRTYVVMKNAVLVQSYETQALAGTSIKGGVAVLRCAIPPTTKADVQVTSWIQEFTGLTIFPSLQGGKDIYKNPFVKCLKKLLYTEIRNVSPYPYPTLTPAH